VAKKTTNYEQPTTNLSPFVLPSTLLRMVSLSNPFVPIKFCVNQRQKTSCPPPAQPVFSIISARGCAKIQSYAQVFWEKIQFFLKIFTPYFTSTYAVFNFRLARKFSANAQPALIVGGQLFPLVALPASTSESRATSDKRRIRPPLFEN